MRLFQEKALPLPTLKLQKREPKTKIYPSYGGGSGNAHALSVRRSTPNRGVFILLNLQSMKQTKTEATEKTAKWGKLLQSFESLCDEANRCIAIDNVPETDANRLEMVEAFGVVRDCIRYCKGDYDE